MKPHLTYRDWGLKTETGKADEHFKCTPMMQSEDELKTARGNPISPPKVPATAKPSTPVNTEPPNPCSAAAVSASWGVLVYSCI